jgi:Ig-like domain from next to BRCA1 gene
MQSALYWGLVANVNVSPEGSASVITDSVTAYSYSHDNVPSYEIVELRLRDEDRTISYDGGIHRFTLRPGEMVTVDLQLRNNGNRSWLSDDAFQIRLGTAEPKDRFSLFGTPEWLFPHRPARLSETLVHPGQVVPISLTLKAPPEEGDYREAFQLIHELRTWCHGPIIRLQLTVTSARGGAQA